ALPVDASAVIYADFAELRQGEILKSISSWSAAATTDADYKQFVNETGFDYEKDLDRVGIAIQNAGVTSHYFVLVDGKFDRKKIETYLRKNGSSESKNGREIFHLAVSVPGRMITVAFLSDQRIALTDIDDLNTELEASQRGAGHAEWTERFERLAGT